MRVTIIIPTYNERENIAKIVPLIHSYAPDARILVVDDNSPDKTGEVVRDMQKNILNLTLHFRQKKEGLGKAYIDAFKRILKEANTDAIIMMDADFSHDPKYLPHLIKEAESCDVIIGSRYIEGGAIHGLDMWRKFLSKFANVYARNIVRIPLHDYTAGFMLIKTEFLRRLEFDSIGANGYAFLIELKSLLWKSGAHFKELPIALYNRRMGESKMSWKIICEGVLAPWRARKNCLRGEKRFLEALFSELNAQEISSRFIFLDIDGTIAEDGKSDIDYKTIDALRILKKENKIVFCSNKKKCDERNARLIEQTGIPCLDTPYKKPNKKILNYIQNENCSSLLVIGDKFVTDGIFAKRIGAEFIKVKRIKGVDDSFFVKCAYALDDFVYLIARLCHI